MKQPPTAPAPMKDSLMAQLTVIEALLRSKKELRLSFNLKIEGVETVIGLTPNLTRVALQLKRAELQKMIGDRIGTDSFKAFMQRALTP